MSTPEGRPKNYIVSGISKSLLTPCRRVGLTRVKKTPKDNILQIANTAEAVTPVNINTTSTVKTQDVLSDKTAGQPCGSKLRKNEAKRCLAKDFKRTRNQGTHVPSECDASSDSDETPKKKRREIFQPPQVQGHVKLEENSHTHNSSKHSVPETTTTRVYVSKNSSVKQQGLLDCKQTSLRLGTNELGANLMKDPSNTSKKEEQQEIELGKGIESSEELPTIYTNVSPTCSSVTHKVTVQIHQPGAKRNINFNDYPQIQDVCTSKQSIIITEELALTGQADENSSCSLSDPLENISLNKINKHKFRLYSSDFEDEKLLDEPCNEEVPMEPNIHKYTSGSGTTLARFKTEDYLTEYSKNPETFRKDLDMENSNSTSDNDLDDFIAFLPGKDFKVKRRKSDHSKKKKGSKGYLAILYPATKTEIVNDIDQQSKMSKQNLIVSLERMSYESVSKDKESANNHINNNCTSNGKKAIGSKHTFENDIDEDFTSSPENDKRQRENLIQLISELEKEVKRKEETLRRLKQAQVYKKMHSPKKLNQSSERWMVACKTALKDLMLKMQEMQLPMDMDYLIKKFNIPVGIIEKLEL